MKAGMALLTVLAVATTAAATIVPAQPLISFKRVAMQTSTDNSTMPTLPPSYTDLPIEAKIRDDGWVSYKNRSCQLLDPELAKKCTTGMPKTARLNYWGYSLGYVAHSMSLSKTVPPVYLKTMCWLKREANWPGISSPV